MFAPSGGYELFIAQHVIEQLDDYAAGLDEAARVLEAGGRALLEIPFDRQPSPTRGSRDRHGRVWSFGQDLRESLHSVSSVAHVPLSEGAYERFGVRVQKRVCLDDLADSTVVSHRPGQPGPTAVGEPIVEPLRAGEWLGGESGRSS